MRVCGAPATSPSTIQATKDMAAPCCRLDMSMPKVVRSMNNIAFSPSVKQSYGRLLANKRHKKEVAGLVSGEIDLSRTTAAVSV